MRSLPRFAQLYIVVLALTTLGLLAASAPVLLQEGSDPAAMIVFAVGIFLADVFPIILPYQESAEVTVSGAFKIGAAMLLGWPATVWVTLLGTLAAEIQLKRAWYRAVFNISQMTLTFAAVAGCYHLVSDGTANPVQSLQNVAGVLLMSVVYFISNTALVSSIISISRGINLGYIFRVNVRDLSWHNLTVVPIGALLPILWDPSPAAMVLIVVPLVVVRESLRISADLRRQTREALLGLADAIDLRDPSTYRHSQRVSELAQRIARRMKLNEEQVDLIRFSARLHDLGKIGMSNSLLYKPGAFTDEERDEFRQHPAIGASLVKGFILFSEGCDLILHHHEAWDGKGYPDGLKGNAISIGSQIISLADAYEAMTADRPYHRAMSTEEAIAEVEARRGSQFSPRAVDALFEILDQHGPFWEDDDGDSPDGRPEGEDS